LRQRAEQNRCHGFKTDIGRPQLEHARTSMRPAWDARQRRDETRYACSVMRRLWNGLQVVGGAIIGAVVLPLIGFLLFIAALTLAWIVFVRIGDWLIETLG
jgi:hypothetical protein